MCCPMPSDRAPLENLWRTFDETEFGASNTLNLRESLPTVADARFRAEQWLRERQVSRAGRVLVITGRGNNSPDRISPVREGVEALFPSLRRRGVISEWKERSPGAFVVSLAPITALLEAPKRKRHRNEPVATAAPATPALLAGLEKPTVDLLRRLAQRSLEVLGTRVPEKFIESEMVSKFSALAKGVEAGPNGEVRLREAIAAALEELDD
jgi:hypothetical protein